MQIARDAAALPFDGAGAKMAQQKNIFKRGADVAGDAFQPLEVSLLKLLARRQLIRKMRPAGWPP